MPAQRRVFRGGFGVGAGSAGRAALAQSDFCIDPLVKRLCRHPDVAVDLDARNNPGTNQVIGLRTAQVEDLLDFGNAVKGFHVLLLLWYAIVRNVHLRIIGQFGSLSYIML